MIAGVKQIRYEVLYDSAGLKDRTETLPSLLHRHLVFGVDGLDILPHQALGVLEVVPALPQYVGRMEGRHRLDTSFEVVPFAAVLGDPEVLVYDSLGGRTTEAGDDPGSYRLYLP